MDLFGLDRAGPVKKFFIIAGLLIWAGTTWAIHYVKFNLCRMTPKTSEERQYVLKLEAKRRQRYL